MRTVIRWLIGLALLAKGIETLVGVSGNGGHGAVIGGVLFAFAFIILGAVVISPELASWAATPFTRFIDGIYLPGGTDAEKPEPNYRLAEHYYRMTEYDLAISEYQKIIHNHPGETRAYIALVDLLANHKGQPSRAAKLYRRGLRKIRERTARKTLRAAYGGGDVAALELEIPQEESNPLGGRIKFPDLEP